MADDSRGLPDVPDDANAIQLHYGLEGVQDPRVAVIVQMMVMGRPVGEIALTLRCDPKTVWNLRRRHNLDEVVAALQVDLIQSGHVRFQRLYHRAIDVLEGVLDGTADKVMLEGARYVVERVKAEDELVKKLSAAGIDLSTASTDDLARVVEAEADGSGGEG